MAKIYPERLPQSVIDDPKLSAERKTFLALKSLPGKFTIFYSIHWQTHTDDWGVKEGEADFIIVHPDIGILVLEVKGGGISYSAERDQWFSQDRYGTKNPIQDPIEQGRRNHFSLLSQLKSLPNWGGSFINIDHAVCFPDVFLRGMQFRPDLAREIILDHDDLEDIEQSIQRVFQYLFGGRYVSGSPGLERVRIITDYLGRSFEMTTPLGVELEYEDQKLVQLTEQQFLALSLLGDRKRAAIAGCAGSGKTMLAIKKAQQLADLDLSVLLTCFNAALADDLRTRLQKVDMSHFHGLCRSAAEKSGTIISQAQNEQELNDTLLPEALMEASTQIGRVYDAIIVDEGQDFKENYWIALETLLKDDGVLFVFFDNNQNLYGSMGNFAGLIQEPPFQLTVNCRNTQAIHNIVVRYHNKPQSLSCLSPEGRTPEVLSYRGENEGLRLLQQVLHRLIVDEHIHPADIAILTPRGREKTRLTPGMHLGMFTISAVPSTERYTVQATSVYRFKGLERRVIILTEIDQRTVFNSDMVMYVGCSRARTHLLILHDTDAPADLIRRIHTDFYPKEP